MSSPIDGLSAEGVKPVDHPQGRIEFRDVSFSYPSRPDTEVLAIEH
jgi:hypothetical protein